MPIKYCYITGIMIQRKQEVLICLVNNKRDKTRSIVLIVDDMIPEDYFFKTNR